MRKIITAAAIAVTLASGLSFAAADKDAQSQSNSGMMNNGMNMEMMGDMGEMMKECRDMMEDAKASHQQNGTSPDAT
ncbi:hypothetical protein [Stutzerimonas stutzeri]|jgi:hypothetical protein|uniref:Pentapeptide MXKDX repeat protein n=1 Tax=Stutzerimonas stutzeri TaxID=316 RepID=A0A5S5BGX4_STUST|nr:hypothetical protein [Stutzerimonas stutzeri]TYP66317.1 hypothetical protein A9A72_121316 [Stutzerimonas stutzeri]